MLASMTSWLTPSSLFVLLNIVIGTIVLTSRFTSSRGQHHHYYHQPGPDYGAPPLVPAPSLLERVKSIDLSFYKFGHPNHEAPFVHPSEPQYIAPPQPLERAPSILERVKSIDFFHKFAHENHDTPFVHPSEPEDTAPPPPPLERAPSLLDRVKSINFSLYKFAPSYSESDHVLQPDPQYEAAPQPDFPQPTRAPSLLERVKSIDFTLFYRSDSVKPNPETELIPPPAPESVSGTDSILDPGHANRSKSEKKVTRSKWPEKMKKSVSENSRHKDDVEEIERRRPETARLEKTGSIGDVDAKADDFINKFKQQLKLQRLDSLLRYKEMLKSK